LAAFLSGCAGRAPDNRMAEVSTMAPESWNASPAARAGVDREWIDHFGDANLSSLVNEAMSTNPDLRVAADRVKRAEILARLAGSSLQPQVQAGLKGSRTKQQFVGFPFALGDFTSESYGASLDVSWEPDVWGRVRASQSAAIADLQAQAFDYKAARTSMAAQIA
jgi:outer membrane protein TolC